MFRRLPLRSNLLLNLRVNYCRIIGVSILVVMDLALQLPAPNDVLHEYAGFNPYYNGFSVATVDNDKSKINLESNPKLKNYFLCFIYSS